MTVNEFLGMAFDNAFEFNVFDFSKNRNIFESRCEEELPEEIGDLELESWNLNNGSIDLNVCTDEE